MSLAAAEGVLIVAVYTGHCLIYLRIIMKDSQIQLQLMVHMKVSASYKDCEGKSEMKATETWKFG
jgi:hypothetical protein